MVSDSFRKGLSGERRGQGSAFYMNVGQFGQWTIWPGQFGLGQFGLGQFGHQKILDRTTGPDEYNVMGFDFLMTFWGEID